MAVTILGNKKLKVELLADESTKTQLAELNVKYDDLDGRVDTILTTPAESVSAQEIIDARQGEASLGANITKVKSQLVKTTSQIGDVKRQLVTNVIKRPFVTFIDDDISPDVWTRLKPLFESKNVPCVLSAPLSLVNEHNLANLLDVQNRLGWEIASHGNLHVKPLDECTEVELESELMGSYDGLRELGLDVENFVYPFGSANQNVRAEVAKIYNCGVSTNHLALNDIPLKQYFMGRTALGSYFDPLDGGVLGDTLAYYKGKIDEAIANKSWCVFMIHIAPTTETQLGYISELIDYIQLNNVEVVTLKQGLEVFGNTILNGDFLGNVRNDKFSLVTKSGLSVENLVSTAEFDFATPITSYPIGFTHKAYIDADNKLFPYGAGLVVTYREKEGIDFSYQLYYPHSSNLIYRRYVKSDYITWSDFRQISSNANIPKGTFTAISPYDSFPENDTSIVVFETGGEGFPSNQPGVLITRRYEGLSHQTFYRINNPDIYTRYWDIGGSAWAPWVSISAGLPKLTVDVNFETINAQTSKTVIVSYTGVTYGDFVAVSPYNTLPNGISIYASQYDANLVTVTIVNSTTEAVAVDTKKIILKVLRN